MQTFLPYPDFHASAKALDRARLGKQRVEGLQILSGLLTIHKSNATFDCDYGVSLEPPSFKTYQDVIWVWNPHHRTTGWVNHPAARMWRGYEEALVEYVLAMCAEWFKRGYVDNVAMTVSMMADLSYRISKAKIGKGLRNEKPMPPWLGSEAFHLSHQSNLLRKDSEFYTFDVPDDLEYVWPV